MAKRKMCKGFDIDVCPNEAEYWLKNGPGDHEGYCLPCFEELVVDMLESNDSVDFWKDGNKSWEVL